jgi:hypothetical protein
VVVRQARNSWPPSAISLGSRLSLQDANLRLVTQPRPVMTASLREHRFNNPEMTVRIEFGIWVIDDVIDL